jgi:hypothetical protein
MSIDTDREFQTILAETIAIAKGLDARIGGFSLYQNIGRQLEAMRRWTAHDRRWTMEEEKSIDVGLLAVRELDPDPSPEVQDLSSRLCELNYYFDRSTRLCEAAERGELDKTKKLLDRGADPNAKDYTTLSALYYAVSEGHSAIVDLLIKRGAHVSHDLVELAHKRGDTQMSAILKRSL